MSIDKHIKEKKCIKYTYHMFKEKNKIDFDKESNEIYLNEKKNIFKPKPFKLSIALTILLLILTVTIIVVKDVRERKQFQNDIYNIVEISKNNSGKQEDGQRVTLRGIFSHYNHEKYPYTLYSIKLNVDNYYIMCGYREQPYQYLVRNFERNNVEWSEVSWIKYDNGDEIKKKFEDKYLFVIYNVYDVLIIEDLLNNKTYNKVCKYYNWSMNEWVIPGSLKNEMILGYDASIKNKNNIIFDDHNFSGVYELIYDKNSDLNIVVKKMTFYGEEERPSYELNFEFGVWYDKLIPYCIDNKELRETLYINGYKRTYDKVMIKIKDIKKILQQGG